MNDKYEPPPLWKPEPIKLVEVPEPDEEEELADMLDAIRAAKDPDTELITDEPDPLGED